MAAETVNNMRRQKQQSYFNVCLLGELNGFLCGILVKIEALVFKLIYDCK